MFSAGSGRQEWQQLEACSPAAFIRLEPRRYLVTTLWSDAAAHQHYSTQHLPALRSRAAPENDLQSITGHALPLEADWRVLPEERPSAGG